MALCDWFVLIASPLVLIYFGRAHAAEGRAIRALEKAVQEREGLTKRN